MSNFKEKNIKYSTFCQNVLKESAIVHGTLDAKHNEIMKDFAKKKKSLPKLIDKLNEIKQVLEKLNDSENYKEELTLKLKELEANKKAARINKNKKNQIEDIIGKAYTVKEYNPEEPEENVSQIIKDLKERIKMLDDFFSINKLKNSLIDQSNDLEQEIQKLEENEEELTYLLDTADILFKYYDSSIKETKKTNVPTDLQDFFVKIKETKKSNDDDKYNLFNKYMKITAGSELKKKSQIQIRTCDKCKIEKTLHLQDGFLTCTGCGDSESIQMDSDKPNFKDQTVESKPNGYKRMNHFSELLNQCQGKESTDIQPEIFERIINELNVMKITDLSKLDNKIMRTILKNLNLNSYYEHIPYIINKLNGIPPPTMSRELEEKVRSMFKEVQEAWISGKKSSRKNFLNNNFVFHKIFELLEEDTFLQYFPYLKSRDKLQEHDDEWKKICEYNRWEFIASL
jgi:hypothetical protein